MLKLFQNHSTVEVASHDVQIIKLQVQLLEIAPDIENQHSRPLRRQSYVEATAAGCFTGFPQNFTDSWTSNSSNSSSSRFKMSFLIPSNLLEILRQISSRRDVKLVTDKQVHAIFREAYVVNHYRRPHQPWKYYIHSIFHLHNETFNIWSHLLFFFLFLYLLHDFSLHVDLVNHPQGCVVLGFAFGTFSYTILSAIAHLFHSKSELVHQTVFQLDYAGIGINSMGCSLITYYFGGTSRFYNLTSHFFVQLNFFLGFLVCMSCGVGKLIPGIPASLDLLLKTGSIFVHSLYIVTPYVFRIYECFSDSEAECPDGYIARHTYCLFAFLASAFFYVSHFPERQAPGSFDLICHSHGLFHICMSIMSLLQYNVAFHEIKCTPESILNEMTRDQVTCSLIFTGLSVLFLANIAFVVVTHPLRIRSLKLLKDGTGNSHSS